ncbi:MGH1-like glycoside hydrolase domain-containing protein [Pirellulimonas nuda]|uniref:MGH1-like glycoside hydrolase domain-containing protein n=1 Tax=Pirellulimonas nuda TaxID=2528009 RepID=UPI0018D3CE39|nr:glycosyl hydrolase family 65 protein [Pirellulimonas nuda]
MASSLTSAKTPWIVLGPDDAQPYVDTLNANDKEDVVNLVPNKHSLRWITENAPLFDCPSTRLEEVYYFRWWTYRKHIKQTPGGRVLTEFITPVSHAGHHNTIACAFGHHVAEGRWLWDQALLDDYALMWFRSGPGGGPAEHFHKFSSWAAAALYDRYRVNGNEAFLIDLLEDLVADYRTWEAERRLPSGLFYQFDVRDGMEESISGDRHAKNIRPTINCYMAANARAIASIAALAGRAELAEEFSSKVEALTDLIVESLWHADAEFFKARLETGGLSDAREAIGFIPWTFGVAGPEHAAAWRQIKDPNGFWAPCGLTTAERRHPEFRSHGVGTCEWDGAVWPFATSQTLVGLANLLRGPEQSVVTRDDYFEQLVRYATSHQQDGKTYIGEYCDETTGAWLITGPKAQRSRFYNHSTFCDLVIGGLVGLVPRSDNTIEVSPLLPSGVWEWFCLDGVPYHGHSITVIWDKSGERYGRRAGLTVWCDGEQLANRKELGRLTCEIPANDQAHLTE